MKRWTTRILILLLLVSGGAIVNVAVAWGCAMGGTRSTTGYVHESYQSYQDDLYRLFEPSPFEPDTSHPRRVEEGFGVRREQEHDWSTVRFQMEIAGWPYFALCGASWTKFEAEGPREGWVLGEEHQWLLTVDSSDFIAGRRSQLTRLPLRPIWLGFAINTVFYAALLWLLFFTPSRIRRALRLKRGGCPKCAYDLRGSSLPSPAGREAGGEGISGGEGCPECGWRRAR